MLPFDLGPMMWTIIALVEAIVFVTVIMAFVFWFMPPISRKFIRAKWSKGVPAFIQNETGKVALHISDKTLPEGVVHYKRKGWFLISKTPYNEIKDPIVLTETEKKKIPKGVDEKSLLEAEETILQTPILEGFGKQVFFGCSDSIALANLGTLGTVTQKKTWTRDTIKEKIKTVFQSKLTNTRLLAPIMYSKTIIDYMQVNSRMEGQKLFGQESVKIIVMALAIIGCVGVIGIVFWFLTQGGI